MLFSRVPLGGDGGSRTDIILRVSSQKNQKIPQTSQEGNIPLSAAEINEKWLGEGDIMCV